MSQTAIDFGQSAPRPRAARTRTPLIGGRSPIARQASADGAALNAPKREDQCARLLRYFEACGIHGATDAEVERDLKWKVNVVTARRNDLYRDGLAVIRWPQPRRRSITTNVEVIVTVATSVVRAAMPEVSELSAAAERDRTNTPFASRRETSARAGYAQQGIESSDVGDVAKPDRSADRASCVSDMPPLSMTSESIRTVAYGTRVVLADGRPAQMRMVTRAGLATVYVFATRELVTLAPASLMDYRTTDGELRQIKECV